MKNSFFNNDRHPFYLLFSSLKYVFLFSLFCCEDINLSPPNTFIKFYGTEKAEEGKFVFEIENNYYIIGLQKEVITVDTGNLLFVKTDTLGEIKIEKLLSIEDENTYSINNAIVRDKNILVCGTIEGSVPVTSYLLTLDLEGKTVNYTLFSDKTYTTHLQQMIIYQNSLLLLGYSDQPIEEEIIENTRSINALLIIYENEIKTRKVIGLGRSRNDFVTSGSIQDDNILFSGALQNSIGDYTGRYFLTKKEIKNNEVPIWDKLYQYNQQQKPKFSYIYQTLNISNNLINIGNINLTDNTFQNTKILFLRLNENGDNLFFNILNENDNHLYVPRHFFDTSDQGYIITGFMNNKNPLENINIQNTQINLSQGIESYIYLAKVNEMGILIWETTFGSQGLNVGNHVIETQSHHFLLCGTSSFANNSMMVLIKTDKNGMIRN